MYTGYPNAIFSLAQSVLLLAGIICCVRSQRFIKGSQAEKRGNLIAKVLTILAVAFLSYSFAPVLLVLLSMVAPVTITEVYFAIFGAHYNVFWLFFLVVCLSLFALRRQGAYSSISTMSLCGIALIAISALIPLLLDPPPEPKTYTFDKIKHGQDDSLP